MSLQIFHGEFDAPTPPRDERAVNLEMATGMCNAQAFLLASLCSTPSPADGSKVEAKTPNGTRIATPNASTPNLAQTAFNARTASPAPSRPSSTAASKRPSYAAALRSEPTDWHLEFFMGDKEISLDTTIFGAVHQFEARQGGSVSWGNTYTVKYRKVPGPAKTLRRSRSRHCVVAVSSNVSSSRAAAQESTEGVDDDLTGDSLPDSIRSGTPQAKILQLLRVLHTLYSDHSARHPSLATDRQGDQSLASAFINNKLTAKLNRQLEEPMIVASACLPDWSMDLPQAFPFLFPFETRFTFLQSTSFGYARLLQKWTQTRPDQNHRDQDLGFLGRLQRQKVRISRNRLLETAFKVQELYGGSRSMLEFEYFEEVGTGLGPTLEWYRLMSNELVRRDLRLWRDSEAQDLGESAYTSHPLGLFPRAWSVKQRATDLAK